MPNLQYIVNPDQIAEPFRTQNIRNAFVIGCKAIMDLSNIASMEFKR